MKKLTLIILYGALVAGCSTKELSRVEALEIIKQEMPFPKVVDDDIFCSDPLYAKKVIDAGLEDKGFVVVHRTQKLEDIGKPLIEFTEKAKPYLLPTSKKDQAINVQKVKLADEDLLEVTGIKVSDDGKHAVVEYTTGYKNVNDFSALTNINFDQSKSHNANFSLYDDGWRLEKKK